MPQNSSPAAAATAADTPSRRAARFPADRRLVRIRSSAPPHEVHSLVAIDVSATGCRLSGSGIPPRAGTEVLADINASSYGTPIRLRGTVVRIESSAFRRFVIGLQFDPRTPSERRLALLWRDECAITAASAPLGLVAEEVHAAHSV
jgi:hypothetical protein